jgi:5-bromo-4-chloroindolyl phosphate hydrolysis protein
MPSDADTDTDKTENELKEIREELREMRVQMNRIEELLLNNVEKNCKKMGEHIEFVESVYEKVKNPLSYICNKITGGGGSNNALPEPEHRA